MSYKDQTRFNGKLKPEVKTEWLMLLRSGDVKQAKGALRRLLEDAKTFGYCCLGVLSDMYVKSNTTNGETDNSIRWEAPERNVASLSSILVTPEGTSDGMPTFDVNVWAFDSGGANGWYIYIDEADANDQKYARYLSGATGDANSVYLPQMNDSGASFSDIADVIEKYL